MGNRIALGILLSLGLSAKARIINVRGKVADAANKPIANAVVELLHAKLKDTTGADGAYSLNFGSSATRPFMDPFSDPLSGDMRLDRGCWNSPWPKPLRSGSACST